MRPKSKPKPQNMRLERDLLKYLKKVCSYAGILYYRFSSPSRRGVPDCVLICPGGKVLFVELKNPEKTGKLSKLQEFEIARMRANGATVLVIDSVAEVDDIARVYGIN